MTETSASTKSPEQIWECILAQLQFEMSRANFDTWVKPAVVLSFDGEMFILGCHNEYGRDWIENRLGTTIQRMISGIIGHPITIGFKVIDPCLMDMNSEDNNSDPDQYLEDDLVKLEPVFTSLRDALLEPNRVVKFPTYFLRWLPYVGAKTIFEVMGFWQEYYLASKGKQPGGGEKVSTRIERIGAWSGISRAQLFRDLADGQPLFWFIKKIETDFEKDRKTGRAKKSANKYLLYGIPLTPGDAEDLESYLIEKGIRENPHQAIRAALDVQPNQILRFPFREPPDDYLQLVTRRVTIQDVISRLVGHRLDSELAGLADQLADRLIGSGEFILVRWYFLNHWLPVLGHNPAMLVILLRNLCFFNDETGEIRDEVWIENGCNEIAERLGLENPRQVSQWFPAMFDRGVQAEAHTERTEREIDRRTKIKEALENFLERIDYRPNGQAFYDWQFRVQRMDPLTPEHNSIIQAAGCLFSRAEEDGVLPALYAFLDWLPNDCFETLKKDPMIVLRLSKIDNDCFETLETIFNDCFATLKNFADDCFETLLKTLKTFKDSQIEQDSSTNQDTWHFREHLPKSGSEGRTLYQEWKLESLLANVNPQIRERLLCQERSVIPFLSWILYGMGTPAIQNPVSLAISKLKTAPNQGAGGAFERVARLPLERFISNLNADMTYWGPTDEDWRTVFGKVGRERKRMLFDLLGIPFENTGE
jgi:hypothetical protein